MHDIHRGLRVLEDENILTVQNPTPAPLYVYPYHNKYHQNQIKVVPHLQQKIYYSFVTKSDAPYGLQSPTSLPLVILRGGGFGENPESDLSVTTLNSRTVLGCLGRTLDLISGGC